MSFLARNQLGASPTWASDMPKRAVSEATTRSQCRASSLPPAMASPCTTATTGNGQSSIARSMTSMPLALPAPADLLRSAMSSPAQKTLPLPRMTTTRSSAATGACSASIMSCKSSLSRALRFSGRFIQMVLTGPSLSMMTLLMSPELLPQALSAVRFSGPARQGKGGRLHEELFRFAIGVKPGHELAVAVVELGRDAIALAERLLGRLAPPRMRHLRVDVGPEAVLAALQLLPERDRPLGRELDADDPLKALEAVFPRGHQAQRRAVLLVDRLAVQPGGDESEVVHGLVDRQPLGIGPGIGEVALLVHHRGLADRLHHDVLRGTGGLAQLDQRAQRKAAPRHDHRPGFDAALTMDALFERHLGQQVVDADLERFVDQAAHLDRPGPDLELLGVAPDALVEAEFVIVVVGGGLSLGGDRRRRPVAVVARGRIELGPRVLVLGAR